MTMRNPAGFLVPILLLAAAAGWSEGAAAPRELSFEKLNRSYTDFVGTLEPVTADPVTVHLASPTQVLHLKSNRVWLTPRADGAYDGRVEAELLGKGRLVADVDVAGVERRLVDDVIVPPQTVSLAGRVRLLREMGGYRGVVDRLPERVKVAIQSQIINDILSLCEGATLLSFGAVDCRPLGEALTRPALSLPPSVEIFLADDELEPDDRAALDALLPAVSPPVAPAPPAPPAAP